MCYLLIMAMPSKGARKSFLLRMPLQTHEKVIAMRQRNGWTVTDTINRAIDEGMEVLDAKRRSGETSATEKAERS